MVLISIWINGEYQRFKCTHFTFLSSGDLLLDLEDGTQKLFEKGTFEFFGGFAC